MRGSKIIKSGDNAYTFRVDFPSADGNRKQKRITVKGSYKDAERRQREILSQIDQGCFSVSPAKMTLGEFLDYYLEIVKGKRESTYKGYVKSFKVFRKLLGNQLLLSEIKTDVVQRAVNELSSKLKNSSVERYFVNFKTSFKYASSPGVRYTLFNPCDGVIVNKPDNVEKEVWDDEQSNRFIRFCKATKQKYAALYVMLLKTGARIGEVLALRWTDLDFDAGLIRITRTVSGSGKGYNPPKSRNSIRKVPLDGGTLNLLLKHRVRQGKEKLLHGEGYNAENLVFCTRRGKRQTYSEARRVFQSLCTKAGLSYIAPHGLRHTHATFLLMHGHSVNAVAERLGDDPKTIMKTYAHVLPGMQKEMVKTIEQLYE